MVNPNIQLENTVTQNFGLGSLEALPIGILIIVIGMTLGGTTGYAINPARDFGPRLIYAMLPRKNKKPDWNYSWVPVVGPLIGGILAGLIFLIISNYN
jgi:glycerol uptake facilitator protein